MKFRPVDMGNRNGSKERKFVGPQFAWVPDKYLLIVLKTIRGT